MAKIAWARGFFRAWVLLAILWGLGAAAVTTAVVLNPYVSRKVVAQPTDTGVLELFDMYGEPYSSWSAATRAGEIKETTVVPGYVLYTLLTIDEAKLTDMTTRARVLVDDYIATQTAARRSEALVNGTFWGLVPPLVVFVIGWALAWVLTGFRRGA